ncbi:MAG: hypothetical protein KC445_16340 [Anaerolineales bacterium]|nr:hypothetical protein [Anaerolineales bacterium]
MLSAIENNKLALIIVSLVVLALLVLLVFSVAMQFGGMEVAGATTLRYCVSSGGVCTGGI